MTAQPRHVVCVLGTWKKLDAVEEIVAKIGGEGFKLDAEYSQLESDDRMPAAFEASADRVDPSITDDDEAAINRHTAVAYVMSPPLPAAGALDLSAKTLAIVDALLDAGALAVKSESAGVAHGAKRWRKLAKGARKKSVLDRADALRLAFVRRPIGDGKLLYSCGMHLLGERDIEIRASDDVFDDIGWMDLLAIYLLAEKPARGVHAGEGFRQEAGGERRVLRARTCKRYDDDDFFYNPYGYWRMAADK